MALNDDEFDEMSGYSNDFADDEDFDFQSDDISSSDDDFDFQSDDFSGSEDDYIVDSPDFADDVDFTQNLVQPGGTDNLGMFTPSLGAVTNNQQVAAKTHSKYALACVIAVLSVLAVLCSIIFLLSRALQGVSSTNSGAQITSVAPIPATVASHYWTSVIDVSNGQSVRNVTRSEYGLDPLWGEYTLAPGEQVTNYYVIYSLVCNIDAGQVYFSLDEASWRNCADGAYVNLMWHSDSQTYSLA